ncbi:MAG: NAD(P)H-hydrate dehydratase [Bacillota bacterium]|jgi:hydroxyethylthiazole kinase-like uncharacterized protein yjeF
MWLVTAEEMRVLDQTAINEYGIPGVVLMENAGLAVVNIVRNHFAGNLKQKRILILAGKGNNGGDGLVVARHLVNSGSDVKVFLLCKPEELQGDAAINWKAVKQMNIPYQLILSERDLNVARVGLMYSELVIDAIFGTGFKGAVQGLAAKLINLVNEAGKPVVAVDLPSGAEANTGAVRGTCIKATYTVTFGLPKIGLVMEPAARYTGDLTVGEISIPQKLMQKQNYTRCLLDKDWCRKRIPKRGIDTHKGDYGHVLVVGGSPGMTGAVALAATAAVRSGAGLVTVAVPQSMNNIMEIKITEAMSQPLPETVDGTLALSALNLLDNLAAQKTVVFGPGLSRQKETQDLVRAFVANLPSPVVLDADALFALAGCRDLLKKKSCPVVLTPHPGEMAHLVGCSTKDVQSRRMEVAEQVAREWHVVLVLKGAKTIIATPDGRLFVNPTGNPGMATGGSGDVLAGIIGAFMAQGLKPENAAAVAVYLHGLAGDEAARVKGMMSLAAGDLIEYLPIALKELETIS